MPSNTCVLQEGHNKYAIIVKFTPPYWCNFFRWCVPADVFIVMFLEIYFLIAWNACVCGEKKIHYYCKLYAVPINVDWLLCLCVLINTILIPCPLALNLIHCMLYLCVWIQWSLDCRKINVIAFDDKRRILNLV